MDKEQIHKATDKALKAGYTSLVVSGVFCPVNSSQEEATADIIRKRAAAHHAGELKVRLLHNRFLLAKHFMSGPVLEIMRVRHIPS